MANLELTEYVDIVNIDRYDLLMGTPFMHRHNVILDFDKKCVMVDGKDIPTEAIINLQL